MLWIKSHIDPLTIVVIDPAKDEHDTDWEPDPTESLIRIANFLTGINMYVKETPCTA